MAQQAPRPRTEKSVEEVAAPFGFGALDAAAKRGGVDRLALDELGDGAGLAQQAEDLAGHVGPECGEPAFADDGPFRMGAGQEEASTSPPQSMKRAQDLRFLAAHDVRPGRNVE